MSKRMLEEQIAPEATRRGSKSHNFETGEEETDGASGG